MRYGKVQFIGYELNTSPTSVGQNPTRDPLVLNKWFHTQKYHDTTSFTDDMTARVSLMDQAVQKAHTLADKAADCLKVFVAPEFYFRGATGAYDLNDAVDVLIPALQGMVCEDKFADWLFVFGSIIGCARLDKDPLPLGKTRKEPLPTGTHEVYNIVLVQDGAAKGIDGSRVVMKEFCSGIDFLQSEKDHGALKLVEAQPAGKLMRGDVSHLPAGVWKTDRRDANIGLGKEKQTRADSGLGIFVRNDVTIGVEVCLDHAMARLRRSPVDVGDAKVCLHLVPSAGMRLKPSSVVAQKGGYAFNCDGAGYPEPSVLMKVSAAYGEGGEAKLAPIPKRASAVTELHKSTEAAKLLQASFPNHAQGARLAVYAPQPLPAKALMTAEEAKSAHWVADSSRPKCARCGAAFSLTNRKHHCRRCGEVVCGTCSPTEAVVPWLGTQKVRVCRVCASAK